MASNVQAGTRGLSAGDWIRLKRLRGSRNYQADKDGDVTNPAPTLLETTKGARRVFTEFGTSKIRRPASFWTDYRASQTADYVLEAQDSETKSRQLTVMKNCNCNAQTNLIVRTGDTIYLNNITIAYSETLTGVPINSIVYFTNLVLEGKLVKNNTNFYIVFIGDDGGGNTMFSISQTPGGTPIDLTADGVDISFANIYIPLSISAIKHNGLCIKCIHS